MPPREAVRWSTLSAQAVAQRLASAPSGLTSREAKARLERTGPNALPEKPPPSALSQFAKQFTDVTVLALIAAAVIAGLLAQLGSDEEVGLARFKDTIAIALIVVLNAVVGFAQERKAEHALRALRELGAPEAAVLRDGRLQRIAATELVVGDVAALTEGDRVPADLRLFEVADLSVAEAALTGESMPVEKDVTHALEPEPPLAERCNMVFVGTHVVHGQGRGIVVSTGADTELGKIAGLLGQVESPQTPLQAKLRRFGLYIVLGCVAVGAVVFLVGLARLNATPGFLLLTAVSLAVAVIPEGLPAITTIVLALGVQRMARKNALVRQLAAVETLGTADVICTDKTGTLTQNRMAVRKVYVVDEVFRPTRLFEQWRSAREQLLALGTTAAFAPAHDDPTDAALVALHEQLCQHFDGMRVPATVRVVPFDSERKMASVIARVADAAVAFVHGAPEAVLLRVDSFTDAAGQAQPLDAARRTELESTIDAFADEGLRVLALAQSPPRPLENVGQLAHDELVATFEHGLVLVGLVGLADPPRPEVAEALSRAGSAGVTTIMITGDHPRTARAIARELGVSADPAAVVSGTELQQLSRAQLDERAASIRVVARATAEDKLTLVQALRRTGHVVAMTGDGVNDAPAIKAANIGVAMGNDATDVTREAADMVIYDGNYSTIVTAIAEGRIIYGNIKRFIVFLFAANAGLVIAVFVAAMLALPPILTPTQILWINLITNGLPALALGMEPIHGDPMTQPPRSPTESLIKSSELASIVAYGAVMAVLGLGSFVFYSRAGEVNAPLARSVVFTVLALSPLFHAFNARSARQSAFRLGLFSNWRLIGAFGAALVLQGVAVYLPLGHTVFGTTSLPVEVAVVCVVAASGVWWTGEAVKLVRRALGRVSGRASDRAIRGSSDHYDDKTF